MILKNLHIRGFRSLFDVDINMQNLNIIVGGNDSGKSNILRAIRAFLQPQYVFDEQDYPKFPRFSGSGSVKDNPVIIEGKLTLNKDTGSVVVKKAISNLAQINNVIRQDNSYNINYVHMSNGQRSDQNASIDAKSNLFLPRLVSIDLANAYASLEDGNWTDLIKEINNTIKRFESEEDKRNIKTLLNSIVGSCWNSDNMSSITISTNGDDLEIECSDTYRINTSLGQRGTGFQAFVFTALKILNAVFEANSDKHDLVILIEEPERMLHPQGQSDFVKMIANIIKDNPYIIFCVTTHSPIIVRTDHSANILLVKKSKEGKSVVDIKPHRNNWKSLRDSLGMRPSDSMLIGDVTVIVEGACEQVFLPTLMQKYCNIDISLFNFISAEGVTNISYYAKIIRDMNTNVIAIFDNDELGNRRRQELIISGLIEKSNIITYVSADKEELAFEDIFLIEDLFEAVVLTYTERINDKKTEITADDFNKFCTENPILNYSKKCWATRMSEYLASLQIIQHKKDLDKFSICKYCIEKIDKCPEQIVMLVENIKELVSQSKQ